MKLHGTRGLHRRQTLRSGPNLEEVFSIQLRALKLPTAQREYRFHPKRQWRFDFAWPQEMVAVEIDGGTYLRGRHVQPEGFRKDCIKLNSAALMGWRVLRGDSVMVKDGSLLDAIVEVLREARGR
jgi:very-short-patch-repair endonuclease